MRELLVRDRVRLTSAQPINEDKTNIYLVLWSLSCLPFFFPPLLVIIPAQVPSVLSFGNISSQISSKMTGIPLQLIQPLQNSVEELSH